MMTETNASKMPPIKLHISDGLDGVRVTGEGGEEIWLFDNITQHEFAEWSYAYLFDLISDVFENHGAVTITIEAGHTGRT